MSKEYDVVALGELLIDFTESGLSAQGNPLLEVNPGGAPGNVLSMLQNYGRKTAFIGKVGKDMFGRLLLEAVGSCGIDTKSILVDDQVHTTLAFVQTFEDLFLPGSGRGYDADEGRGGYRPSEEYKGLSFRNTFFHPSWRQRGDAVCHRCGEGSRRGDFI